MLPDMLATLHGLAIEHDADIVKADFDNVVRLSDGQTWALREGFGAGETTYYDRVISLKKHPELYIAEYLYWRGLYKREFLTQHGLCFQETPGHQSGHRLFLPALSACGQGVFYERCLLSIPEEQSGII